MNLQFPNILRLVREKNINLFLGEIKLITTRAGSVILVAMTDAEIALFHLD